MKRRNDELEERAAAAAELCVQSKVLEVCGHCDTVFARPRTDPSAAYALGAQRIAESSQLVVAFRGDLRSLRAAIAELLADTSEQCECPPGASRPSSG